MTWAEFQAEFASTWIENYLRPVVTERLDAFMSLTEPLLPRAFGELSEPAKIKYLEVRDRHFDLGATVMLFTTYVRFMSVSVPVLPLRERFKPTSPVSFIPADVLDATSYQGLLDALIPYCESIADQLRGILRSEGTSSPAP